jgi:hypothetical protein
MMSWISEIDVAIFNRSFCVSCLSLALCMATPYVRRTLKCSCLNVFVPPQYLAQSTIPLVHVLLEVNQATLQGEHLHE